MGLLLLYTDEEEEEEGTVMALLVLEEVLDRDRFDILRDGYVGTGRRLWSTRCANAKKKNLKTSEFPPF